MKRYEGIPRIKLTPRMPMILRIDGRAFHTYVKKDFKRLQEGPWSDHMRDCMTAAAKALLEEVAGAKIAYVQSDEVSVLVTDDDTLATQPWFDKGVQKVCSVSASIATVGFNQAVVAFGFDNWATFDARCFVIPREEVCNYFIWRQQDAERNSVQMLAQAHFSHKQLQGKSRADLQRMLIAQKSIRWDDLQTWKKLGWCVHRTSRPIEHWDRVYGEGGPIRTVIEPDWEIPWFTQSRDYIEKFLIREG